MERLEEETRRAGAGCPLRMSSEWIAAEGPLACVHCCETIGPGELFLSAGRCAMGGVVTGPSWTLYSDTLEPAGEHVRCAPSTRDEDPVCYTVGHGTRALAEFIDLLREQSVELVADIRTVPKSRHNPQFAGEALQRDLPPAGLCYLHLPGLGGLRKPRTDSPNGAWRNDSFRGYADYMLTSPFEDALAELITLLRLRRTAIMCAETVYWRCHRSPIADALAARGVASVHLLAPGKAVPHALTRFARVQSGQVLYPPEAS